MKPHHSLYIILIALSSCLTASLSADSEFAAKIYQTPDGESLNYRLHLPENMDPTQSYPLVLFLHGAGERGSDNEKQLKHGAKKILAYSIQSQTPAIIVAPQCPTGQQWVNTPWANDAHTMPEAPSDSMRLTIELLEALKETLPVDSSRIAVTGLSMGGFGTWDIIQRMPTSFSAAMPICGGGDTAMAETIKGLPIWVFHGALDTAVKTQRSRDMVEAIQQVGGKVRYTEYEDVGHGSWGRAYNNQEALKWLFETRNPNL